jgi:SAM-dependent methyltransferase
MSLHDYVYPDPDDRLALAYDEANEPYPGYWRRSEEYALQKGERIVGDPHRKRLLDLGCGMGRMLRRFAPRFKEVTGIEPDRQRASHAFALVEQAGLENVRVVNGQLTSCCDREKAFDVVLCSHVLQHVSVSMAREIIRNISVNLAPDGILILLTTRTRQESDIFTISSLSVRGVSSRSIGKEEFSHFSQVPVGHLPVRLFCEDSLRDLVSARFRVETILPYRFLSSRRWIDSFVLRDQLYNGCRMRIGSATNQMLIARHPVGGS